ncbi:MAG: hypothetical protein ACXABY_28720 [Candidatus Thorarchaeota archaeon]|jgi:hypothetical protein
MENFVPSILTIGALCFFLLVSLPVLAEPDLVLEITRLGIVLFAVFMISLFVGLVLYIQRLYGKGRKFWAGIYNFVRLATLSDNQLAIEHVNDHPDLIPDYESIDTESILTELKEDAQEILKRHSRTETLPDNIEELLYLHTNLVLYDSCLAIIESPSQAVQDAEKEVQLVSLANSILHRDMNLVSSESRSILARAHFYLSAPDVYSIPRAVLIDLHPLLVESRNQEDETRDFAEEIIKHIEDSPSYVIPRSLKWAAILYPIVFWFIGIILGRGWP